MILSRRWSIFLLAFGVWSWVIWLTFIRNIAKDPRSFSGNRPHAFFIVHLVLTVVSIVLGTVIGVLGFNGLRRTSTGPSRGSGGSPGTDARCAKGQS